MRKELSVFIFCAGMAFIGKAAVPGNQAEYDRIMKESELQLTQKKYDLAMSGFERACKQTQKPDQYAKACFRRMHIYEQKKQYAKALECARELESKKGLSDSNIAELCHRKGRMLSNLGKKKEATQAYLGVKNLKSCPSYYCWSMVGAANLFSDMKKYNEEKEVYEVMLKKQGLPNYFRNMALINHAQALQKDKKYKEALQEYQTIKLVNCHPDLLLWKIFSHGECLYRMGNCKDALHVLDDGEKMKNGNPNRHAQIDALRAEIYFDGLKNIPEAKKAIDKSNNTPRATWGKNPALTNRIYGKK